MADGVIVTDLAGAVTYLNPAAEALTGWGSTEVARRPLEEVFKIVLPSGRTADGTPSPDEESSRATMLTTRDGQLVPIEDNSAPLLEPDGSLAGLVIVFRLRPDGATPGDAEPSWSHLVGIVEGIDDPLFSVDPSWRMTYANGRAEEYFGRPRADLVGIELWSLVPPVIKTRYCAEFNRALLHRETRAFELHDEHRDQWFEVHAYPFGSGLLAFFRDVTPRKTAEEQRTKLEKLEALGLLARGFAHDFNNVLTILMGNLAVAKSQIPRSLATEGIENAETASLQAQSLVHQLLTFAKGGAPIRHPSDLGALVTETLAAHPQRKTLSYTLQIPDSLPPADVDPNQIARIITNLLRNAEEASPDGGAITVTISHQTGTGSLLLTVSDTGEGISPHDRPLVCEPFFSTRREQNASGIGLTVCESIVKNHGGEISIISEEGKGTTVSVLLPIADTAVPARPTPPLPPDTTPGRPKRILLLEDEPLIRQLAVANLRSQGYEVETTADCAETVERYRSALNNGVGPFDLLILDLTIPGGMGGARTMEQIKAIDPGAKAIVSSGYSDDPAMARPADFGFNAVLPKPYDPKDLARLVAEVLA